jgi:hypothetical protein
VLLASLLTQSQLDRAGMEVREEEVPILQILREISCLQNRHLDLLGGNAIYLQNRT